MQKGIRLMFLTNGTLKRRKSCAAGLMRVDSMISGEEVITASYATSVYLKTLDLASSWVMLEGEDATNSRESWKTQRIRNTWWRATTGTTSTSKI